MRAVRHRHRDNLIADGLAFTANAIDELVLDVIPVVLGAGERLFTGVPDPGLEPVQVIHSLYATHIRYRLGRRPR